MALLTKNRPAGTVAAVRDRAMTNAQRVVPAASQVGTAVRRTAEDAAGWARPRVDDAAAWAKPRVEDARSWAAPKLERSGIAVQETIGPAIADVMVSAAHAIDVKPARRRRWARPAAITMIVAAVASAAAAVAMRRRPLTPAFPPVDPDSPVDPAFGEASSIPPDPEANGRPLET